MESKKIKLGKSKGLQYTIVDEDIFKKLSGKSCRLYKNGYVAFRVRKGKIRKDIYLHRWITNAPDHLTVDHINFNKLDNRRENLQLLTSAENSRRRPNK